MANNGHVGGERLENKSIRAAGRERREGRSSAVSRLLPFFTHGEMTLNYFI